MATYIVFTIPDEIKENDSNKKVDDVFLRAKQLQDALTSDYFVEQETVGAISRFTEVLNNENSTQYALKWAKKLNLFDLALNRTGFISPSCKDKRYKRFVFYFVSFARELIVHGGRDIYKCRIETLINLIQDCKDFNVFQLVAYFLISGINFEEGGLCMQGSAQAFAHFFDRKPYGVVDWNMLSLFAIWADRASIVAEPDRIGMCYFVDRLIANRANWDKDTKTHFCWLAKNIKCAEFNKIDLNELMGSPECQEFLIETERAYSEL